MKMGYKRNKLQQLKLFCAVIEEGNLLKAANKMNTAQPNVSLQIKSLEKSLNVELFKREKQRLIPTPEALRYYKMCKKSIEEIDFLLGDAMNVIKEDYDNLIKIAAHSYMLSHILPPYFKKIIEINPKVKFELHNSSYIEAMDMLESGAVDFAVYPADLQNLPKGIEARGFYKCSFGLAMAKNHPLATVKDQDITWNMIADHDFVTLGEGVTAQGAKKALQDGGVSSRFRVHNGTWEICSGIINENLTLGGSDVKYLTPFKKYSNLTIKHCPSLLPDYQFYTLTNKNTFRSKSADKILEILQS